ncbi:uncharacterized protein BX663DRAFT_560911 [Cokeromyces recurvatus]|uniref:uncharacterized protein n=1 Tax=Cokeromyces recurvatus TaxID=90255 RepID=UPI00221FF214|nr:uncharacterized protein BX663DRAFT_560911 [Cokeromyces recurvatus]KAI7903413.1 hypothetical protein BX663DRAFT_560911 [Cokeromyces recurvatus]
MVNASESLQSWNQDPWSLLEDSNATNMEISLDIQPFLNSTHAALIQFQDLFGRNEFDFTGNSLYYDELTTFVPSYTPEIVETVEPSSLVNQNYVVENLLNTDMLSLKRRPSSSSSSSGSTKSNLSISSYSSSSSEEEEEHTFSTLNNSDESNICSNNDSDSEEPTTLSSYNHRRQIEEMILEKITNQLDPEKLPGILTIISTKQEEEEDMDEVEIDLARLEYDQLCRILSYIDACLLEKEEEGRGGEGLPNKAHSSVAPKKEKASETMKRRQTKQQQVKQGNNRRRRRRRKSIVELGHVVDGSSTTPLSSSHGPISMSALTETNKKIKRTMQQKRKKNITKRNKNKRKTTLHKRRLSEDDMLQPSFDVDNEEEEEEKSWNGGNGIVIFSDEKMDFRVTQNKTIVHQERKPLVQQKTEDSIKQYNNAEEEEEEDDEIIDIIM